MLEKFSVDELCNYSMLPDPEIERLELMRELSHEETLLSCDKNCVQLKDTVNDLSIAHKKLATISKLRDQLITDINDIFTFHFWDKNRLLKKGVIADGLSREASSALYLFLQQLDDKLIDMDCNYYIE